MNALHDVLQKAGSQVQGSSPDTNTDVTFTPPGGARAALLTCETTDARVTLNGTQPAANNGFLLKKDQNPMYLPAAVPIRYRSSAAAASVVNVSWLS